MDSEEKRLLENSVVKVICENTKGEPIEYGSGFFVDDDIVITAHHVIEAYNQDKSEYLINVEFNQQIYTVKEVIAEKEDPIAILKLEKKVVGINVFKFVSGYEIKRGTKYYALGYPKSDSGSIKYCASGTVMTANADETHIDWNLDLTTRLDDYHGLSGAPVVIDGLIVGIVQRQITSDNSAVLLGISSINILREFLPNKYCDNYEGIIELRQLKKHIVDLKTIDDKENYLRSMAKPDISLSLDFFEIDDEEFKETFINTLRENATIHVVGKSREETLFALLNELKDMQKKVIIVESARAWEQLSNANIADYVLIPYFYETEIMSIPKNISVFVYSEDEHCNDNSKLLLRKRTKNTIFNKLVEAGMDPSEAEKYFEKTNGFYIPLKRKLFNGAYNISPNWSNDPKKSFVVALLCGKWMDNKCDRSAIEELLGCQEGGYDAFISELRPFMNGSEPLVTEIKNYNGIRYQLTDIELAWEYLDSKITNIVWQDFEKIFEKVISSIDQEWEKSFTEKTYIHDITSNKNCYSTALKSGMLRTLILRAIYRGEQAQQESVDRIISRVIAKAKDLESWAYYSQFITDMCEAAPDIIMNKLENGLNGKDGLIELFRKDTAPKHDVLMSKSYYTNILWSIEYLLQIRKYVISAISWLFEMDSFDITYKMANSPKEIMKSIFCAWYNVTPLSNDEKVELSVSIIAKDKYRNSAWNIVFHELPTGHAVVSPFAKPNYRKTDEIPVVTNSALIKTYIEYAELCIENMYDDIGRWKNVLDRFNIFPNDISEKIMGKYEIFITKIVDKDRVLIEDVLRTRIYNYRYFLDWGISEETIKKLEHMLTSIKFSDEIYEYVYLFSNMKTLHPVSYKAADEHKKNEEKRENEIRSKIENFKTRKLDIMSLVLLINKKDLRYFGYVIARYYSEGKFDFVLYKELLKLHGIDEALLSYVEYCYSNNKDFFKKILDVSKKYGENYYVKFLMVEDIDLKCEPAIVRADDNIKQKYWRNWNKNLYGNIDKDTLEWVLNQLSTYNNFGKYIEILYNNKEALSYEFVLNSVNKTIDMKEKNINSTFYIEEIIDYLEEKSNSENIDKLYAIEFYFLNILDWDKLKTLQAAFKFSPSNYTAIIDKIFKHQEEIIKVAADNEMSGWFSIYQKAKFCPCNNDGNIDEFELKKWVADFRQQLKKQKQENLFGILLGRLLAFSPVGADGQYPHEAVRKIIENLVDAEYSDCCRNYKISEYNARGSHWCDAGKSEKELALQYKENADKIRITSPKTAKIYDALYSEYLIESEAERRAAEDGRL